MTMNDSWKQLYAALNAVSTSDDEEDVNPSNQRTVKSGGPVKLTGDTSDIVDKYNSKLKEAIEEHKGNLHPEDVVLGRFPGFVFRYIPGTSTYRRDLKTFGRQQSKSSKQNPGYLREKKAIVEKFADEVLKSIWDQGGRFLRIIEVGPNNPQIHVADMITARNIVLKDIEFACSRARKQPYHPRHQTSKASKAHRGRSTHRAKPCEITRRAAPDQPKKK